MQYIFFSIFFFCAKFELSMKYAKSRILDLLNCWNCIYYNDVIQFQRGELPFRSTYFFYLFLLKVRLIVFMWLIRIFFLWSEVIGMHGVFLLHYYFCIYFFIICIFSFKKLVWTLDRNILFFNMIIEGNWILGFLIILKNIWIW